MTSGVPWQFEARETAREAARRSGVSLGEWIDSVINNRSEADARAGRACQFPDEASGAPPADAIAEVRGRLDEVGRQLDQLTRPSSAAAYQSVGRRGDEPRGDLAEAISRLDRRLDQLTGHLRQGETVAPAPARPQPPAPPSTPLALAQALTEIAQRQRTLDGVTAPARSRPARPEDQPRPLTHDLSGLEQQLRQVTTHIETLRPCGIEKALDTLRDDLAEIALMVKEATPRRAIEALESEVRNLSERLYTSPLNDATEAAIASVERGLAEVRDALRALTPAENLAGMDETMKDLSRRIDLIATHSQDPGALEQVAGAITDLHGMVTQVASNGAIARLSDEVAELAARVEQIASSATTGTDLLSTLEHRIASMADALEARRERGQTTPGDLDAVVKGLLDKLEGGGFARFDQAGVGILEERIAALLDKLDTSSSRLDQLETVERGLTDLMTTLERRSQQAVAESAEPSPEVSSLRRDMQQTRDSLQGVQGALGSLVERLAAIESDMRKGAMAPSAAAPTFISEGAASPAPPPARPARAAEFAGEPDASALNDRRTIDPSLPPDHPLEPGAVRSRNGNSPGERIAASEAALAATTRPVIPDPGGKSNFIAAARRAAQAASSEPSRADKPSTVSAAAAPNGKAGKGLSNRVRAVLVAASVVVIVLGSLHVVASLFTSDEPQHAEPSDRGHIIAPEPVPEDGAKPNPDVVEPAPGRQSLLDPQSVAGATAVLPPVAPTEPAPPPAAVPVQGPAAASEPDSTDTTKPSASIPSAKPAAAPPSPAAHGSGIDRLPPTFSNLLRTAAAKGDPGAEYEIAQRFADGRGVPQNLAEAADWFDRAANQGLVLAQFRLGGFYEKGFGVKKDLEAARRLYTSAAEAGNAKAMHNLAVLYAEGIDGKPDYATATKWFRQAASYGLTDSQYNLGILYARGIGVEISLPEAYKWFALAAREGDKDAANKRDDVGGRLDARALAAAKLDLKSWTALEQPEAATRTLTPPGGWDPIVPAPAPATPKPRNPGARAEASNAAPAR